MNTKYGGYSRVTQEPHRPGPDNPPVLDSAKFPTVKDVEDRIRQLQGLLGQDLPQDTLDSVRENIRNLEAAIEKAWARVGGRP